MFHRNRLASYLEPRIIEHLPELIAAAGSSMHVLGGRLLSWNRSSNRSECTDPLQASVSLVLGLNPVYLRPVCISTTWERLPIDYWHCYGVFIVLDHGKESLCDESFAFRKGWETSSSLIAHCKAQRSSLSLSQAEYRLHLGGVTFLGQEALYLNGGDTQASRRLWKRCSWLKSRVSAEKNLNEDEHVLSDFTLPTLLPALFPLLLAISILYHVYTPVEQMCIGNSTALSPEHLISTVSRS